MSFFMEPAPTVAMNDGKWRLVYFSDRPERPELFDKEADPREQRNLAQREGEVAERLSEQVQTYLERTFTTMEKGTPAMYTARSPRRRSSWASPSGSIRASW